MIRNVLIPLFICFLPLCEQMAIADLTDDLEDLEPDNLQKQAQPIPSLNTKQKQKMLQQDTIILQQGDKNEPSKLPNKDAKPSKLEKETSKKDQKTAKPFNNQQPREGEKKLPVIFEGDQLSGIKRLGTIELHQNVKVSQGDFNLEAENAKVLFDTKSDEVKKVIAKGSVKMSKVDPQTGELIRAYSQIAEFHAINQTVELIDKAKLIRGEDVIRGQVIIYDLKTGRLKASKVKGVVKPQENQDSASEE